MVRRFVSLVSAGARAKSIRKFHCGHCGCSGGSTFEADPDLAILKFGVFSQDKDIKQAYAAATQSMQRIATLAQQTGLQKQDVTTGTLKVRPFYEGDRKRKIKSYAVHGEIALRVHDFSKLGVLLDGSVDDGISDFRSLSYSLDDEEQAKKRAVAEAMDVQLLHSNRRGRNSALSGI